MNTLWPEYFMASLDVESLFTNISLKKTIKFWCESLFKNLELLSNIIKNQFQKLLRAALSSNYFLLHGIVYEQVDEVAIGCPLGPSVANAFLAS